MDATGKPDLPGFYELYGIIIIAVPIALLVSLALLRIYRRSVVRSMQQRGTPAAVGVLENRPARCGEPPGRPLEITPHDPPPDGIMRAVRRVTWPSASVEVCAGLTYGIVMASSFVVAGAQFYWHQFLFYPVLLLMSVWFAWPMVITVGLASAVSWRGFAMLVVGYTLALAGGAAAMFVPTEVHLPPGQVIRIWLFINGPGTLLALAFLARPIRAVGLLVLVFMIAAVAGSIVVLLSSQQHPQIFDWIYRGVLCVTALLTLTGVIGIGIIGWLLFRWFVTGVTAEQVLANWLNANAIDRLRPFTLARPITAVVVVFVIAAVGGAVLVDYLLYFDNNEQELWLIGKLSVVGNLGLVLLAGAVPAGIIGWLVLRWLGNLYRARQISDQSIMIDAIWLMFSFAQSPFVSAPLVVSGSAAIGAFVAYKLAATTGYRLLRTGAKEDSQAFKLLLLRVFALGTRSEHLFAGFTKLWRHIGSVRMIAGPDLATSTVEPYEFLDFVAGRLQRRFISSPDTLEQRLRETDQRRDGNGRFRIADFFCHDDTWQMTLRRLEKDTDVVLMDLRGFSQNNRGCVFEIKELLDLVLLRHIVFVVDRTTDERFLAQVFADAWATITNASPNWNDPAPRVRLYRFDGHVGQDIPALVAVVANAGMHHPMRNESQETSQ